MIDEFKDDYEIFHSAFQIEHFILIKNGKTTYGIYKQCLRELSSREGSLRSLYAKKLALDIDMEELELEIQGNSDIGGFEGRRQQIKICELAYGMKELLVTIRETEREYTHFYNAGKQLKHKLGPLDASKRAKLETELWAENCKYKVCSDLRTVRAVSAETFNLINSMPNSMRLSIDSFVNRICTVNGTEERDHFLAEYSRNFEFTSPLDRELPFNIKGLVENGV